MGNFEKLSVLVIVVIIVMILVVALYTWTDKPQDAQSGGELAKRDGPFQPVGPGSDATPPAAPRDPWVIWDRPGADDVTPPAGEDPVVPPTPEEREAVEPPAGEGTPETTPEQDGPWEYVVQAGDTLSQICQRELGTVRRQDEVKALNPTLDVMHMRVGEKLKMPPKGRASSRKEAPGDLAVAGAAPAVRAIPTSIARGEWYVLRAGDRLSTIAKKAYGSIERWPELWARNLAVVKDPDAVVAGTRIFIPE